MATWFGRVLRGPAALSRVALLSIGDADDVKVWSGIPHHVKSALVELEINVVDISPLAVPQARLRHLAFRAARRAGRSYRYELDTACIRSFGRQVRRSLHMARVDAVISMGVLPIAGGTEDVPVATWADATIENLAATYREYQRLPTWQHRNAERADRHATEQADVLTFASAWAADSAVRTFGADPNCTLVAPFGANLVPPSTWSLDGVVSRRPKEQCRLVWIGADWERKRGDFCIQVAAVMGRRGNDVELTLVGAAPPVGTRLPACVHCLGFIDKSLPQGRDRLTHILDESHFLLLPSRAECFGIAVAEANAHAVPCLGSRVGGLADAVRDGVNGFLFAPDATAADFAETLAHMMEERDSYNELARCSRREYEDRLNWRSSCRRVLERLACT